MDRLRKLDLTGLSEVTRTPIHRLIELAVGSDYFYQRRTLVSESGKKRELLVPAPELKKIQIQIYRRLLRPLRPHKAVACVRGRGVRWAVTQHSRRPVLLHEDIADFFPSVGRGRVVAALQRFEVAPDAIEILSGLVTAQDQLPQGAPTSTAVGDLVLFKLDCRLGGLADSEGLTYTRYVDDLAFSGGMRLQHRFEPLIHRIIAEEGWRLNAKGGTHGPESRHLLLGVVVNSSPNATVEYRNSLRSVLRLIRSGKIEVTRNELRSLRAKVDWVAALNPRSGTSLRKHLEIPDKGKTVAQSG